MKKNRENRMSNIHNLAYIEKGAQIGDNVTVEPFAVIKKNVVIEDGVTVKSNAYIDGYTTIKENTVIWPGANIGNKPQDLKYKGEKTFVEIGKNCQIREYVTINSSCIENSVVKIGNNCLIMAYCHVAHDCTVGNNVIMANSSQLAGHIVVEDFAIIGGMTPIHQFVRIGRHAMVGGFSGVSHDVPPYTIGNGLPYRIGGLNIVGLKRRNFPLHVRNELTKAFKYTYRSNLKLADAIKRIENELEQTEEVRCWVDFIKTSKRGITGIMENFEQVEL